MHRLGIYPRLACGSPQEYLYSSGVEGCACKGEGAWRILAKPWGKHKPKAVRQFNVRMWGSRGWCTAVLCLYSREPAHPTVASSPVIMPAFVSPLQTSVTKSTTAFHITHTKITRIRSLLHIKALWLTPVLPEWSAPTSFFSSYKPETFSTFSPFAENPCVCILSLEFQGRQFSSWLCFKRCLILVLRTFKLFPLHFPRNHWISGYPLYYWSCPSTNLWTSRNTRCFGSDSTVLTESSTFPTASLRNKDRLYFNHNFGSMPQRVLVCLYFHLFLLYFSLLLSLWVFMFLCLMTL